MILDLYLVLLLLSLLSLVLGYFTDADYLTIVGFFFLFYLSTILMTGNLEYQVGVNDTTSFVYSGGQVVSATSSESLSYANFNSSSATLFGKFLAVCTGFAFGMSLFYYGRQWRTNRERL